MPTYVHLVRHAQGYHNLSAANHSLPDPDLTPLGKEQCAQLQKRFPYHDQVTHLVASPLRRTLYTCLLSFEPALQSNNTTTSEKKKKVIALPSVQEISPLPCDIGSSPSKLAAEFDSLGTVDLGLVTPDWTDKTGADSPYAPEMGKLEERARKARVWLRELGRGWEREDSHQENGGDAHIVVVTHGGFLHFLTQDFDGMDPAAGTGWANTEWRMYEFLEGVEGQDEEARLKETGESWRRRKGSAKGLTETEQMELRVAVEGRLVEEWGNGNGNGNGKE